MRPSWDAYFMKIAHETATRSTCLRRQVGAVMVRDRRILATGYNGAPTGLPHCLDIGCIREQNGVPSGEQAQTCMAVHAEQNAIIQAAIHGVSTLGATLYCTNHPCGICAKMLINAGIRKLVYAADYPDLLASEMLDKSGVPDKA